MSIELSESSVDHWPCMGDSRGTVVWQTVAVEEPGKTCDPGVEAPHAPGSQLGQAVAGPRRLVGAARPLVDGTLHHPLQVDVGEGCDGSLNEKCNNNETLNHCDDTSLGYAPPTAG